MSNEATPLTADEALQEMREHLDAIVALAIACGDGNGIRSAMSSKQHLDALIARVEATPATGRVIEVGECEGRPLRSGPVTLRLREGGE